MIYLACFAVSVLFAYLANKTQKKYLFWLFSVLSILVTVLLAGLRDYSIGIDTDNYYTLARFWKTAVKKESLLAYMKYYLPTGYGEPLFALLLGAVAQVCGNYSVFLFVVHTVIITCVYVGAFRLRKYAEPALVLLVFYLMYFGQSLNIMRQYMAIAIVFAAFADIEQKKWLRYLIAVVVAALVHTSALLAIYPLLVYFVLNVRWNLLDRKKWLRWGVVVGFTLLAVLLLSPMVRLFMKVGLLSEKYGFYFQTDVISPAVLDSLFVCVGLGAIYYFRDKLRSHCEHFLFYAFNSVGYLLLLQLSWVIIYGKRLAAYQLFANLITVAMIEKVQSDKKKKWIARVCIVGVALVYWLYAYVLRNASQTMPYKFVF